MFEIRRIYQPTDIVLSELVDVLCLLIVDGPAEDPKKPNLRPSVTSEPPCFSTASE